LITLIFPKAFSSKHKNPGTDFRWQLAILFGRPFLPRPPMKAKYSTVSKNVGRGVVEVLARVVAE
jgi:hypothetical protein